MTLVQGQAPDGATNEGNPVKMAGVTPDGKIGELQLDADKNLKISATINVGDIEIGQVELKDADSTAQANIKTANTARTTSTIVVATQNIDATGKVAPAGELAGNAPFVKLTAGVDAAAVDAANTARTSATKVLAVQQIDAAGNVGGVQGGIASHAADSGNPVKVGGKYNATPPTLDDGDRGDLQLDVKGNTKITQATTLDKTNDSITNYPVGCNMTVVDLATDADVVVSATPAVLVGIYVNTVFSAHAVNILDGATTKLILPASLAAGTEKDMRRATFATSLIVNSDDAATGSLVLFWRPL